MRERRRRSGDGRCRTGSLNGGFISTRADRSAASPAAAKARAGAATSRTATLTRAPRPLRCTFSAAKAASSRIDLDQRDVDAGDARGERQSGRAHARAEIDRALACARRARRRQQNRVVADPVPAPRLREPQPAAEHGIFGDVGLARPSALICHRDEARVRGRPPGAAARASRRAVLGTRMRRGRMPIEPSSTLMFWSSTTCGIPAPSSSAWMAETSTVHWCGRARARSSLLSLLIRFAAGPILRPAPAAPDRRSASPRGGPRVTVSSTRPATIERKASSIRPVDRIAVGMRGTMPCSK